MARKSGDFCLFGLCRHWCQLPYLSMWKCKLAPVVQTRSRCANSLPLCKVSPVDVYMHDLQKSASGFDLYHLSGVYADFSSIRSQLTHCFVCGFGFFTFLPSSMHELHRSASGFDLYHRFFVNADLSSICSQPTHCLVARSALAIPRKGSGSR